VAAKSINLMTRQRVRNLAGKLMEEWQNVDDVAEVLGCQPKNVRRWYTEYQLNASERHGSAKEPGRPSKLTFNQQSIIEEIILTKTPGDMNQPKALWSNKVIRDTIRDLFRIELSLATVNAMTQKMGIARRQIFRSGQNHTNADQTDWVKNRFPFIRKLAKEQSARIFFIHDEKITKTGTQAPNLGPVFELKSGPQPFDRADTRVLSAVCPRNSQRFMTFYGPLGLHAFVEFLNGLIQDIDRHIFLIAESRYKPVALEAEHFLSSNMERLSLFFLPDGFAATP
jgi:transposase